MAAAVLWLGRLIEVVNFTVPQLNYAGVADFPAVEDVEDLVAFTIIRRPVNGKEPPGWAIQA